MKKNVLLFCMMALFSVFAGCAPQRPEAPKPITDTLTRDEYAVYRDIVSGEFGGRGATVVKK
jgi:hypothetical protein